MTAWDDLDPTRAVIAGDWHGASFVAVRAIEWAAEQGADVILHVGDYGYDFAPKFMSRVSRALRETGLTLAFSPGNHEKWPLLDALEAEHGCTAIPMRTNIFYLPRCYRWTWSGVSFLALGGAHSVDRPWRTPGREWWARETIEYHEAQRATDDGHADVMISHDVPAGVFIPGIAGNPHGFPQAELDSADRHRQLLRQVVDQVTPKHLYAGHYHCRHTDLLRGEGYETKVTILADDSAPLADNLTVVDLYTL